MSENIFLKFSQTNVHRRYLTYMSSAQHLKGRWCRAGENSSADTLIPFCTSVWLTVANLDGKRWRGNCWKASPSTSLFLCRGFTRHHTELFRTWSLSNFHPRFYKTLKNAFGKIFNAVSLFPYKHVDIATAPERKN